MIFQSFCEHCWAITKSIRFCNPPPYGNRTLCRPLSFEWCIGNGSTLTSHNFIAYKIRLKVKIFFLNFRDFSLDDGDMTYEYLSHPGSYRTCLLQVCQSGYHAFAEADDQMQKIAIMTDQVKGHLSITLQILFEVCHICIWGMLIEKL